MKIIHLCTLKMCGIPNKKLNMQTMRTNNSCLTIYLSIQSPNPSLNDVIMTSTVENLIIKKITGYQMTFYGIIYRRQFC